MAGRDARVGAGAASRRQRRLVAQLARPRVQVARAAAPSAPARGTARTTSSARRAAAERARSGASSASARAQAVVDVQRRDGGAPASATATSSRHVESRPPESIATSGAARHEQARCAATRLATSGARASRAPAHALRAAQEQLGGLREALQPHLADAIELEPVDAACDVHDRARDEHLAAARARDHARRLVDLAPVVVAVAVERLAVVHADARLRVAGLEPAGARPPTSVSAAGSEPTTMTSSPSVLITRASSGSVCATASTKRSTVLTACSSPCSSVSRV